MHDQGEINFHAKGLSSMAALKSTDDFGVVPLAHHHQEVDLGNEEAVKLLASSA